MDRYLERLPLVLLLLFTIKLLALNTWGFESAAVFAAISAVCAVFHIKAKNEEISELKENYKKQQETIDELKKADEHVKNSIAGLKMASTVKVAPKF